MERSLAPNEGKGTIVAKLKNDYQMHIRVGGPNAGHTFYDAGNKHKMQVIPCGWSNPEAVLVLGRGMLINPIILLKELEYVEQFDPNIRKRIKIDSKAGILDPSMHYEGHTTGELHQRIGSTGEGVGAARMARVSRDPSCFQHALDVAEKYGIENMLWDNTPLLIRKFRDSGHNILLEGTQGSALSLIHGPWPYVTSTDTNAAQILADVGIPPSYANQIICVARTFPIRVAGNSGPMFKELDWSDISKRRGVATIEQTTVTKKTRRVSEWDPKLLKDAITLNAPTSLAITFMDYLFPKCEGVEHWLDLPLTAQKWLINVEHEFGVPISLIGTGGEHYSVMKVGDL